MNKHLSSALLLGACAMASVANAQFYVVKDGKVKVALDYTPDYVTFENPMLCGGVIGDAVDLGLSVKWSSVNVGASSPEDYGNYYAWGETETKDEYSWATYKLILNGFSDWEHINKYQAADNSRGGEWYNANKEFVGDGKTTLKSADDAATVNWGGGWAMPTLVDWTELCNNCYCVWISNYNSTNVAGYIIYKAKADGDKGQVVYSGGTPSASYSLTDTHIFLPAAGCRYGSYLIDEGSGGYYWSSALNEYDSDYGRGLDFSSGYFDPWSGSSRCYGQTVRPVCPPSGNTNGHVAVDLGLPTGKLWATCNVGASAPQASGNYYAWGETVTKTEYTWANYALLSVGGYSWQDISKYTIADGQSAKPIWFQGKTFVGDNKTALESADDAATANWGDDWRMPTQAEWQELYNNTTRQWTTDYNGTGVSGYILTSTKAGHTDAHIFLPAAGYRYDSYLFSEGSDGYYWSSTLNEGYSSDGRSLGFSSGYFYPWNGYNRCYGLAVRPVCPKE